MPTFLPLVADAPVRVQLSATDNGIARGGVTMYSLKPGRIVDIQGFTGNVPAFDMTLPRAVTRLVVEAHPSVTGTISVKMEQDLGNVTLDETVQEDTTFVFDVV